MTTTITKPMSDKQLAFIKSLDKKLREELVRVDRVTGAKEYRYSPSQLLKAIESKVDKITTRLASKVIGYLKNEWEVTQESWRRVRRGHNGASFYGANIDLWGEEEEELMAQITAL